MFVERSFWLYHTEKPLLNGVVGSVVFAVVTKKLSVLYAEICLPEKIGNLKNLEKPKVIGIVGGSVLNGDLRQYLLSARGVERDFLYILHVRSII